MVVSLCLLHVRKKKYHLVSCWPWIYWVPDVTVKSKREREMLNVGSSSSSPLPLARNQAGEIRNADPPLPTSSQPYDRLIGGCSSQPHRVHTSYSPACLYKRDGTSTDRLSQEFRFFHQHLLVSSFSTYVSANFTHRTGRLENKKQVGPFLILKKKIWITN